jgi:hypothetical protein
MLLETAIMWTPWAVGMADAGLTAYYTNNFVTNDVNTAASPSEIGGNSGHALLGLGAASLAVQSWIFYLVAIVSAALDVHLVTNFGDVNANVDTNTGKLNGSYGNAVEGMSYATLGVGGLSFFVYLYAEFFTRRMDEPHPTIIEAHGGS